jgi:hypothetical protein
MRGRYAIALFGAALVALPLAAGQAAAQSKKVAPDAGTSQAGASDLERVINILQDMGYRAATDNSSTPPAIDSKFAGINSRIQVLNCDEGTTNNCGMLRFHAGFDLNEGLDLKAVNDWNLDKYFGRAYLDAENDPILEMDVNIDYGVTRKNLEDTFDWWRVILGEFTKEVVNAA